MSKVAEVNVCMSKVAEVNVRRSWQRSMCGESGRGPCMAAVNVWRQSMYGGSQCMAAVNVWRRSMCGGGQCMAAVNVWRRSMFGGGQCVAAVNVWRRSMYGGGQCVVKTQGASGAGGDKLSVGDPAKSPCSCTACCSTKVPVHRFNPQLT
jgi:hypothetical protein